MVLARRRALLILLGCRAAALVLRHKQTGQANQQASQRGRFGDIEIRLEIKTIIQAEAFENTLLLQDGARLRRVRVVRDYGMYDRREAPQYFPDAPRPVRRSFR